MVDSKRTLSKYNPNGRREDLKADAERAKNHAKNAFPGVRIKVGIVSERGEQAVTGFIVTLPNEADQKRFETLLKSGTDNMATNMRSCFGGRKHKFELSEPR